MLFFICCTVLIFSLCLYLTRYSISPLSSILQHIFQLNFILQLRACAWPLFCAPARTCRVKRQNVFLFFSCLLCSRRPANVTHACSSLSARASSWNMEFFLCCPPAAPSPPPRAPRLCCPATPLSFCSCANQSPRGKKAAAPAPAQDNTARNRKIHGDGVSRYRSGQVRSEQSKVGQGCKRYSTYKSVYQPHSQQTMRKTMRVRHAYIL